MKRITLSELRKLIRKTIVEEYLPGCPECGGESIRDELGVEELPRTDRLLCASCAGLGGHWKCSDCGKWNIGIEQDVVANKEPCVHCGSYMDDVHDDTTKTITQDRF